VSSVVGSVKFHCEHVALLITSAENCKMCALIYCVSFQLTELLMSSNLLYSHCDLKINVESCLSFVSLLMAFLTFYLFLSAFICAAECHTFIFSRRLLVNKTYKLRMKLQRKIMNLAHVA